MNEGPQIMKEEAAASSFTRHFLAPLPLSTGSLKKRCDDASETQKLELHADLLSIS
jgi:hypothetical protein